VRCACEGGEPKQTARSVATGAPHRLHTSCAPHSLHTVDSTDRRRPARAPRLRRRRAQSDCSFRRYRRVPPSSHLCRDPPSSHSRLHWLLASCACAAPLARPTVFTPSIPLTVCVMRLRHAVFTVDSTGRWRPSRAPRLRRRRAQADCSFRCHRRAPPSSHLLRASPSSHRRLHRPSASCACAAPAR